jgi:hypothetical protein
MIEYGNGGSRATDLVMGRAQSGERLWGSSFVDEVVVDI